MDYDPFKTDGYNPNYDDNGYDNDVPPDFNFDTSTYDNQSNYDWDNYQNPEDIPEEPEDDRHPREKFQDIYDIIDLIQDKTLRERTKLMMEGIDLEDPLDTNLKIILNKSVEKGSLLDGLDDSQWDGYILTKEQKKI